MKSKTTNQSNKTTNQSKLISLYNQGKDISFSTFKREVKKEIAYLKQLEGITKTYKSRVIAIIGTLFGYEISSTMHSSMSKKEFINTLQNLCNRPDVVAYINDDTKKEFFYAEFDFERGSYKWHRTNGPAVEWADGRKEWYLNGKLHREDGPAVEYVDDDDTIKKWYVNGEQHRIGGPAVVEDQYEDYFVNGYEVSRDIHDLICELLTYYPDALKLTDSREWIRKLVTKL
jgi:hypothetical protein